MSPRPSPALPSPTTSSTMDTPWPAGCRFGLLHGGCGCSGGWVQGCLPEAPLRPPRPQIDYESPTHTPRAPHTPRHPLPHTTRPTCLSGHAGAHGSGPAAHAHAHTDLPSLAAQRRPTTLWRRPTSTASHRARLGRRACSSQTPSPTSLPQATPWRGGTKAPGRPLSTAGRLQAHSSLTPRQTQVRLWSRLCAGQALQPTPSTWIRTCMIFGHPCARSIARQPAVYAMGIPAAPTAGRGQGRPRVPARR